MEFYKIKETPKGLSQEEHSNFFWNERFNSIQHVTNHIDEIKQNIKVQLDKPGDPKRSSAVEEIFKYLYELNTEEYNLTQDKKYYSLHASTIETLIYLNNIIEAVNSGDTKSVETALKSLPWGDSNTGDQISHNATQFALWILSDEDKNKYSETFVKIIENKYFYREAPNKFAIELVNDYMNMSNFEALVNYNNEHQEKINQIRSNQPQ